MRKKNRDGLVLESERSYDDTKDAYCKGGGGEGLDHAKHVLKDQMPLAAEKLALTLYVASLRQPLAKYKPCQFVRQ